MAPSALRYQFPGGSPSSHGNPSIRQKMLSANFDFFPSIFISIRYEFSFDWPPDICGGFRRLPTPVSRYRRREGTLFAPGITYFPVRILSFLCYLSINIVWDRAQSTLKGIPLLPEGLLYRRGSG